MAHRGSGGLIGSVVNVEPKETEEAEKREVAQPPSAGVGFATQRRRRGHRKARRSADDPRDYLAALEWHEDKPWRFAVTGSCASTTSAVNEIYRFAEGKSEIFPEFLCRDDPFDRLRACPELSEGTGFTAACSYSNQFGRERTLSHCKCNAYESTYPLRLCAVLGVLNYAAASTRLLVIMLPIVSIADYTTALASNQVVLQ